MRHNAPAAVALFAASILSPVLAQDPLAESTRVDRPGTAAPPAATPPDPSPPVAEAVAGTDTVVAAPVCPESLIRTLTSRIANAPCDPELYVLRAEAFSNLSTPDLRSARADLDEALRLAPWKAEVYAGRACVNLRDGQVERAMGDLFDAIRLDSSLAEAFAIRGIAFEQQGNTRRAMDDFTKARRLDPDLDFDEIRSTCLPACQTVSYVTPQAAATPTGNTPASNVPVGTPSAPTEDVDALRQEVAKLRKDLDARLKKLEDGADDKTPLGKSQRQAAIAHEQAREEEARTRAVEAAMKAEEARLRVARARVEFDRFRGGAAQAPAPAPDIKVLQDRVTKLEELRDILLADEIADAETAKARAAQGRLEAESRRRALEQLPKP